VFDTYFLFIAEPLVVVWGWLQETVVGGDGEAGDGNLVLIFYIYVYRK